MRSARLSLFVLFALGGCGSFESDSTPPPEDNTQPAPTPIDGKPIEAIYVSVSVGSDGGDGSIGRPYKTIRAGLAAGKDRKMQVLVCAEEIVESVELVDGVSVYGSYDCTTSPWARNQKRTVLRGAGSDPAMQAVALTLPTRVDGFDLVGPNIASADKPSLTSSYGMIVRSSVGLILENLNIRGGVAADGKNGVDAGGNTEIGNAVGGNALAERASCSSGLPAACLSAIALAGSVGGTSQCLGGSNGYPGGQGGEGLRYTPGYPSPDPDEHGKPNASNASNAAGGAEFSSGNPGGAGAPGTDGKNGVSRFTSSGFEPGDGTDGKLGNPGQGGGGGGGANKYCGSPSLSSCSEQPSTVHESARGGGGGAGGCGGLPGKPGTGGGASVGLFVASSEVTIGHSRIEGGTGGRAGAGTYGSLGLAGANGGFAAVPHAGGGGRGGDGGPAGLSGNGAAGPSIGLVFADKEPRMGEGVELAGGTGGYGAASLTRGTQKLDAALQGESLPKLHVAQ